jgi:hypothetical protein
MTGTFVPVNIKKEKVPLRNCPARMLRARITQPAPGVGAAESPHEAGWMQNNGKLMMGEHFDLAAAVLDLKEQVAELNREVQHLRTYKEEQDAGRACIAKAMTERIPVIIAMSVAASRAAAARDA